MELDYNSPGHRALIVYLNEKVDQAESALADKYEEWRDVEQQHRAYVNLSEADKAKKERAQSDVSYGGPVPIVLPFMAAQHISVLSFLHATFTRRVPKFGIEARHPKQFRAAKLMESLIEYQGLRTGISSKLYFFLNSFLLYGLGAAAISWREEYRTQRFTATKPGQFAGFDVPFMVEEEDIEEEVLYFEGNDIRQIDPYYFLLDPNVSVPDMQTGEFVGHRFFRSIIQLLRDPDYVNTKFVEEATKKAQQGALGFKVNTNILLRDKDKGIRQTSLDPNFVMLDEISIDLIPSQFDLSDSDEVERWLITVANRSVIVRAEPQGYYHGEFPFIAAEYRADGFNFLANKSYDQSLEDLQRIVSWHINSRIDNTKQVMNNLIAFNPLYVNESDIKDIRYGGRIRITASGETAKNAIFQIPFHDVTTGHITDANQMLDFMKRVGHTSDNFMGFLGSGRRSAREVSGSLAQGGGVWQTEAELLSDSALRPMIEQMISNNQQFLEEDAYIRIAGPEAAEIIAESNGSVVRVSPSDIRGEFLYRASDGTYPFDKAFLAQSLREFLSVSAQMPEGSLGQVNFPLVIKEYFSALGFRNLDSFILEQGVAPQVMPNEQVDEEVRKGNLVPADDSAVRSAFAKEENDRVGLAG